VEAGSFAGWVEDSISRFVMTVEVRSKNGFPSMIANPLNE